MNATLRITFFLMATIGIAGAAQADTGLDLPECNNVVYAVDRQSGNGPYADCLREETTNQAYRTCKTACDSLAAAGAYLSGFSVDMVGNNPRNNSQVVCRLNGINCLN